MLYVELKSHRGFDRKVRSRSTVLFHVEGGAHSIISSVRFDIISLAGSDNPSSALAAGAAIGSVAVLISGFTPQTVVFLPLKYCVSSSLHV